MTVPELRSDWYAEIPLHRSKDSAQVYQTLFPPPGRGLGDETNCYYSTDHKQLNIYTCVLAKSSRVRVEYSRARIHCPQTEYYTRSYIRGSCEWQAREHCKRKYYYTRTYGPRMRVHAYLHSRTCTRTVLALVRTHSYCTRECCIDLSRALAPPSQVKCEPVLSYL